MAPIITQFTGSPLQIDRGGSAILRWNVFLADQIIISNIGIVPFQGSQVVYPTITTTYVLTATSGTGTVYANITIHVTDPIPPTYEGKITYVNGSPNPVDKGGTVRITASCKNEGNVEVWMDANIWRPYQGDYWFGGAWIPPGGTFTFSRTNTNIQDDTEFQIICWVWDGAEWHESHVIKYTAYIVVIPPEPEVICTPGEKKCIGDDLYECNSAGTKWDLKESNAKICETGTACPNFWTDPVGAVICWIIGGLEGLLGWTQGSLLTTLGNVRDLITNFFGDIYDFFSDVVGSVVDIINDNVGSIFDWLSDQFFDFVDWLRDIQGDIAGFVTDAIGGAIGFLETGIADLWTSIQGFAGDIADAVSEGVSGFVDWSADQLGSIWEGIQTWFAEAISGFVEAFFGGVNTGIEQAKTSPLHSDEPVRNPVLKGLQKVVRKHRKKHNRDEITGEIKHGNV